MREHHQVQGIDVTPLNVEVFRIKPQEQEGKVIYSLKLERHNFSYLCTAQNKETNETGLVIGSNKVIKQGNKRFPNPQQWRGHD
jgi:hypothetical protein